MPGEISAILVQTQNHEARDDLLWMCKRLDAVDHADVGAANEGISEQAGALAVNTDMHEQEPEDFDPANILMALRSTPPSKSEKPAKKPRTRYRQP